MNKNTSSLVAAVWLLLLPALATTRADSQTVPALINYQGRLVSSNGLSVATSDYELRFSIWDSATGGTLVWGPQLFDGTVGTGHGAKIPVVQGWFNVMLGPQDTSERNLIDAFSGANRFVEIQIGNNAPIAPRQRILSTPFALMAGSVPDGSITAAKVANGSITGNQLATQTVQSSNIADGAVGSQQLGAQAVLSGNIANGAVGPSQLAAGATPFVPRNVQVFTSSGVWVKPAGVTSVYVKVIGRGGNGDAADNSQPRGGGGGGGYAEGTIAVAGNVTVTIGAVNSFAGVTTIQATSGGNASGQAGGTGGMGSGGSINLRGGDGQTVSTGVNAAGGMGGSTAMGAGGSGAGLSNGVTYTAAQNGGSYGGGGGGATNLGSGGIGNHGAVIIYY